MNINETVKELRWLSENDEWVFAAETMAKAADIIESLLAQLAEREREITRMREAQEKIENCESCARYVEECYRFYTYPCSECKHLARDSYVPLPTAPEEGKQI
jgi:protein-arginine kinase activator protein McsA